jgi:hypothetical protein
VTWTQERARVAGLKRHRDDDDPTVTAAVSELKAARLAEHIRQLVDAAPPLTDQQRARLVALLQPGPNA